MVKIKKIVRWLILIAQKKSLDSQNATKTTSALGKVPFLKEIRKNGKEGISEKMGNFGGFP